VKPRQYYLDPSQVEAACRHVSRTTRGNVYALVRHVHEEIRRCIAETNWSYHKSRTLLGEGFSFHLELEVIPGLEEEAEVYVDVYVDPAMTSLEAFKTYKLPVEQPVNPATDQAVDNRRPALQLLRGGKCAKSGG
jgi:hypothetical protein